MIKYAIPVLNGDHLAKALDTISASCITSKGSIIDLEYLNDSLMCSTDAYVLDPESNEAVSDTKRQYNIFTTLLQYDIEPYSMTPEIMAYAQSRLDHVKSQILTFDNATLNCSDPEQQILYDNEYKAYKKIQDNTYRLSKVFDIYEVA